MQLAILMGGVAAAAMLGGAGYVLLDKPKQDLGGGAPTSIQASGTVPKHDILGAVGSREATKRANANGDASTGALKKGVTFVAAPVIAEAKAATVLDDGDEFVRRKAVPPLAPAPAPPPVKVAADMPEVRERVVEKYIYVQAPQPAAVPTPSSQSLQRINSQIEALLTPAQGGFVEQHYAKPQRTEVAAVSGSAVAVARGSGLGGAGGYGAGAVVVARAGNTVYATIDRAFNSDDPQAPIFATIYDIDAAGEAGPLHGIRMTGQITYSRENAAILFTQAVLQDGRQIPLRAIAVSEQTARTGIAGNVDNHVIERYGSLLVAGLIQGAGQVGQVLVQGSQNILVNPLTGVIAASQNHAPYYQAGLGAVLPVGQALTAAATQNFARPATISAPAGMGVGVVFLDPVALPRPIANLR